MKKDYTKESLSMYEKKYLENIVINTKNMYLRKNKRIIDNEIILLNDEIKIEDNNYFEEVELKELKNIKKEEFEKLITNPELYEVIKALPKKQRDVLFYLFQENKNISQIAEKEDKTRKTITKYRDLAFAQIKEHIERRKSENGKANF